MMRRASLFLRFFLAACATGAAVGVATWLIVKEEERNILLPVLATGIVAAVLFLFLSYLLMRRYIRKPPFGLVEHAPNLVMKVDPEGRILYASPGVERTLYGMGLPPQHGELLLPDGAGAIVRNILSSEDRKRALTYETEGRTIEYSLYGCEDENAVVFHGVDVTEKKAMEEESLHSRKMETLERVGGAVLLVDDEELVRDVAGAMLASLGFEILTAPDGEEGVEIFRREKSRISFTVLDLRMPVMDGTRAFEEIRRIDPAAKVVISTGFSGDEEVDRLREKGAAAVLSKPYTYREIARVAGLFRVPFPSPIPVQEK